MKPFAPVLVFAALLSGCGFHLRVEASLPFDTIYLNITNDRQFESEFKRSVTAGSKTTVVDKAADAQAVLQGGPGVREKVILSLSSAGRVSAYTLRYRFSFKLSDNKAHDFIPPTEI